MKTGEEKFDDEIRQKLRHSEVVPPAGFFEQIVPPSDNRKGFLWIWIAGILILGITAGTVGVLNYEDYKYKGQSDNHITGNSQKEMQNNASYINTKTDKTNSSLINQVNNSENSNSAINDNTTTDPEHGVLTGNNNTKNNFKKSYTLSTTKNTYISTTKREKDNSKEVNSGGLFYPSTGKSSTVYNYDILFIPLPSLPYNETPNIKHQVKTKQQDTLKYSTKTISPLSLEFQFSKLYGYSKTSLIASDTLSKSLINKTSNKMLHSAGFEVNAGANYSLNQKLSVNVSMHYGQRTQDFAFDFKEHFRLLQVDTIQYYILFPFSPSQLVTEFDSSIVPSSVMHKINHDVTFKTASISLGIKYTIVTGPLLVEPGINLFADVINSVSGYSNFNKEFKKAKGKDLYSKDLQARIAANLRLTYPVSEKFNIFIEPEFRYGLTSVKTSGNFYKEKTNIFSAGAGIKYILFKSKAAK